MRKLLSVFTLIFCLISCNENTDDPNSPSEIIGVWELVQMSGSLPNSVTTGNEMEWQETYQFNFNGTFVKMRERDGTITTISGSYLLITNANESLLELTYNTDSEIIGTCSPNSVETMVIQSQSRFSSTWRACDGPGLIYEKRS